ncbi:MAG: PAS domain S-box protein [Symploca sp. SIO1A3]|nr:PAS domain S-box protein [Symploca sp. SIO1A3]
MPLDNSPVYSPRLEEVIDCSPLRVTSESPLLEVLAQMNQAVGSCRDIKASEKFTVSPQKGTNYVLVTQADKLVGIFTGQNLVDLVAAKQNLAQMTIGDVMVQQPITLKPEEFRDVFSVFSILRQHRICHIPVLDEQEQIIGAITNQTLCAAMQPVNMLKWRSVAEVMNTQVIYASINSSLLQLAQLMAEHQSSCVVITQDGETWGRGDTVTRGQGDGEEFPNSQFPIPNSQFPIPKQPTTNNQQQTTIPIGIVTEQDIVQFQCLLGLEEGEIQAQMVMSTALGCLHPEDNLWVAYQQMQQDDLQHLVVTGTDGELQGIITQANLLQILDPMRLYDTVEVLRQQICQLEAEKKECLQGEEEVSKLKAKLERQIIKQAIQLKVNNQELEQKLLEGQLTEQKLRMSEREIRGFFEAMTDVVIICDRSGQNIKIAPTHPEYLYQSDTDIVQQTLERLWDEEESPKYLSQIQRALDTQQVVNFEYKLLNGKAPVWFSAKISPISEDRVVWVSRDITERKSAEEELELAREQLELRVQERTTQIKETNKILITEIRDRKRAEVERKQAETEVRIRAHQQEAIAQLGQRALVETDLESLMDEAVNLAARILRVEYSKVVEFLSNLDAFRLVAGFGWQKGAIVKSRVRATKDSQAGYTLHSSEQVVVSDLQAETRFNGSSLLQQHGVVSGMSIVIQGKQVPFGVLSVHTTQQRKFSQEDVNFLQAISNVLSNAVERQQAEEELNLFFLLSLDLFCIAGFDGYLKRINHHFEDLLGYTEAEFLVRPFLEFVHPEDVEATMAMVEKLSEGSPVENFENRYRCKDGSYLWLSWTAIAPEAGFFYAVGRDITEHKRMDEALRNLVLGISSAKGEAFFQSLVAYLAKALDVEYALVGELVDFQDERIKTVAVCIDGEITENFNYNLANTPCADLMERRMCIYPQNVQQQFPEDTMLSEMGIESYLGIPLVNSTGQILGLMAVMARKPLPNTRFMEEILQIFGVRAGSELERKKAQEALRESEEKFRQLAENIREVFYISKPDHSELLYISPAYESLFGRPCNSLYQQPQSWIEAIHPEDREFFRAAIQKQTDGVPLNQEYRIIKPDGQIRWIWGRSFPVIDQYGQVYRIVGIAEDISKRKRAESLLLGQKQVLQMLATGASLESVLDHLCHFIEVHAEGFSCSIVLADFEGDEETGGRRDKETRETRETSPISNSLFPIPYCPTTNNKQPTTNNQQQTTIFSNKGKVLGTFIMYRHEPQVTTPVGSYVSNPPALQGESLVELATQLAGIAIAHKQAEAALKNLNDDLEAKVIQRTAALQESEVRFRSLFEQAAVGVAQVAINGQWLMVNQKLCEILGYTQQELLQKTGSDLSHPEDWILSLKFRRALIAGEIPTYSQQKRYLRRDGSFVWVSVTVSLVHYSSEESVVEPYLSVVVEDISDRKETEAALETRIELEQLITSISTQFINLKSDDIDQGIKATLQQIGEFAEVDCSYVFQISDDGTQVSNIQEWCAPGIESQVANLQEISLAAFPWLREKLQRFELVDISQITDLPSTASKEKAYLLQQSTQSLIAVPMVAQSQLLGLVGFNAVRTSKVWTKETITLLRLVGEIFANALERQEAELDVRESEERFRQLAENIESVFWMRDPEQQNIIYVSPAYETIWGRSCAELYTSPTSLVDAIHPANREEVLAAFPKQVLGEYDEEYRIVGAYGEIRWIRDRAFPIYNQAGEVYRVAGIAEDITDRKQADKALRESEERFRAIFEQAAVGIVLSSLSGHILRANRGFCDLLGYSELELLGQTWEEITHPDDIVLDQEYWNQALAGRINTDSLEKRYIRRDGQVQWGHLTISLVHNSEGVAQYFISVVEDVQESKQAETQLKASLKEKELLLKEIHHRVKNNLLVVSSLLELQTDSTEDLEIIKVLEDSQNRIHSMALIHEKLYRSDNLDQINFGEYLESLLDNLFSSYGYSDDRAIDFELNIEPVLLNIETANPCGLIVNELIANIFKHAFPKGRTNNKLWLELHQLPDKQINLIVRDNGIGFPEDLDFRDTESLGLQLVCTLTEQLEGTIELKQCNGTSFQLTFSELHYRRRLSNCE